MTTSRIFSVIPLGTESPGIQQYYVHGAKGKTNCSPGMVQFFVLKLSLQFQTISQNEVLFQMKNAPSGHRSLNSLNDKNKTLYELCGYVFTAE